MGSETTVVESASGMNLLSGIGVIIGLAILFFVCGLVCYCLCSIIFKNDDGIDPTKPVSAFSWTAKHYYDPKPSVVSPPEAIFHPSAYSFKLQNGTQPHQLPHAVINPAVLQFPSSLGRGHVETSDILEDRTAYSSHFQPRSGSCRRPSIRQMGRKLSSTSTKISPSNVPLVHSDMNEMVHMGKDDQNGRWYP